MSHRSRADLEAENRFLRERLEQVAEDHPEWLTARNALELENRRLRRQLETIIDEHPDFFLDDRAVEGDDERAGSGSAAQQ